MKEVGRIPALSPIIRAQDKVTDIWRRWLDALLTRVNELSNPTKITADSITLSNGTSSDSVTDLQTENDGNVYNLSEAAVTPGMLLIVDFVSVTKFSLVKILATYEGAITHALEVELYNWSTASWDHKQAIQTGESNSGTIFGDVEFAVPSDTNYIGTGTDLGKVRVRFNHPMMGIASHDLYIDEVALY